MIPRCAAWNRAGIAPNNNIHQTYQHLPLSLLLEILFCVNILGLCQYLAGIACGICMYVRYIRDVRSLRYIIAVPAKEHNITMKIPLLRNTSTNGGFSIAMLVYQKGIAFSSKMATPAWRSFPRHPAHPCFFWEAVVVTDFVGRIFRPHSTSTAWKSKASSTRTSNPRIGECNIASLFFPSSLWAQSTISILGPRLTDVFYLTQTQDQDLYILILILSMEEILLFTGLYMTYI